METPLDEPSSRKESKESIALRQQFRRRFKSELIRIEDFPRRNAIWGGPRLPDIPYIQHSLRILERWGLEDETVFVVHESFFKDKSVEFYHMEEAMINKVDFVICEPFEMSSIVTRWIVVGNFLYSAAFHSAYTTVALCYFLPNHPWVYWPPFLFSCLVTYLYNFNWGIDPCSNYQVLENPFIYDRFPMHRLDTGKAEIYVLTDNSGDKMHQRVVFAIGLFSVLYYFIFPAPPCICDWRAIQFIRQTRLQEVKETYHIPWFVKYFSPHMAQDHHD